MSSTDIVVKGWRNGLLVQLPPVGVWSDVIAALDAKLDEAKARSFWRGAQTTLDLSKRSVGTDELADLTVHLRAAYGLVPIAVIASDEETRNSAESLPLTAYAVLPVASRPLTTAAAAIETSESVTPMSKETALPIGEATNSMASSSGSSSHGGNALYIPGTVRSGQRIVHNGSIAVAGDVNAGAEVIAEGDVLVFGTLRGLAHAGSQGDSRARILAVSFKPQQLRIADKIARAPEEQPRRAKQNGGATGQFAEVARIENGEIQVFPL